VGPNLSTVTVTVWLTFPPPLGIGRSGTPAIPARRWMPCRMSRVFSGDRAGVMGTPPLGPDETPTCQLTASGHVGPEIGFEGSAGPSRDVKRGCDTPCAHFGSGAVSPASPLQTSVVECARTKDGRSQRSTRYPGGQRPWGVALPLTVAGLAPNSRSHTTEGGLLWFRNVAPEFVRFLVPWALSWECASLWGLGVPARPPRWPGATARITPVTQALRGCVSTLGVASRTAL
jgi:hypothetical protein